jgi:hypothetical protein
VRHFSILGTNRYKDLLLIKTIIMKSNKKTKKLEFTKETIARLGDQHLHGLKGGQGTEHETDVRTRPGDTCTCLTNATIDRCE